MIQPDRSSSISMDELSRSLSQNLRRYAAGYGSISALCRACGVNRQQFNKYLSGETLPSLLNIVKIAEILRVSIDDLVSIPSQGGSKGIEFSKILRNYKNSGEIELKTGYYQEYTMSGGLENQYLITISSIKGDINRYEYKTSIMFRASKFENYRYYKYEGTPCISKDAIYINYGIKKDSSIIAFSVMRPDFRHSTDFIGLRAAMTNSSPAIPFSASFYMKYVGEKPNVRAAFRQCGVYSDEDLDEQQTRIFAKLRSMTQTSENILRLGHG